MGEPVLCAYGVSREGRTLACGLLFVRERLTPDGYPLVDVATGEAVTVALSEEMLGMGKPRYFLSTTLNILGD